MTHPAAPRHSIHPSRRFTSPPALSKGMVHLWLLTIDDHHASEMQLLLSDDERRRAARYAFDRDRAQFIICRGALRSLLAGYLNRPAQSITFNYAPGGKPFIAPARGEHAIEFNLSHTQGVAAIAVACDRPVGVDVEHIREIAWSDAIATRYFAPADRDAIERLPSDERPLAFHRIWTAREAELKVTGEGLAGLTASAPAIPPTTTIHQLTILSHNCVACVAATGEWEMKCMRLDPMVSSERMRRSA